MGWFWLQGDSALAAFSLARNCTTRRAGPGCPPAVSTPHALSTRRRCYPTGWCSLQGDLIAMLILPLARNCTTRRAGPGSPPAASTPRALRTRRRCYPTGWCSLQADSTRRPCLRKRGTVRPGERDLGCHGQPQRRARRIHTATLLPNGMVLVAGGSGNSGYLASTELYDPATGTWTATGSLNTARDSHTATLLPNGMVLVAGGEPGSATASAELYDPASGIWTPTSSLNTGRHSTRQPCCPTGWSWLQGDSCVIGASRERGAVRPGERDLGCHG